MLLKRLSVEAFKPYQLFKIERFAKIANPVIHNVPKWSDTL